MSITPDELDRDGAAGTATRKQIRGSSLLLAGRLISVGLNFATQVLIVRYLSKSDYGAWAYCLALVAAIQTFAAIGLDRSVTRFIPIYHEGKQYAKLFGNVFLVIGAILFTGLLSIGVIYLAPGFFGGLIGDERNALGLLLILIFLVPVNAIDETLIGLFACFNRARAIFVRRHIIAPSLKLLVALLLIALASNVEFLAFGYLAASLAGVGISLILLAKIFRDENLYRHFSLRTVTVPWREIFAFTLPLLSSNLLAVVMHSSSTLILGYFHGTESVASYQVILPAAHFNKLVMTSFALLYTPLAARFFAQGNFAAINGLYWRTTIWLGILSFPLFALTFSLAEPVTSTLYEERYTESALYLQLLALAYFFNVSLGFNGLTLKVLGKVGYILKINFAALAICLVLNFLLIPRYGALGAAISTAVSMILHNVFKQAGLLLASGISLFEKQYAQFYCLIAAAAIGLLVIERFVTDDIYILLALLALVSLAVLKASARKLKVEETFPELLRIPIIGALLR